MSCFTRLFRRSRHQGEERQQPSVSGTSHGSAIAQQQQSQPEKAGTRQQPAARYFHFTYLSLPFLSNRSTSVEPKTAPTLIDDLRAAGLTFDCMTLSGNTMADPTSPEPARKRQKRAVRCHICTDTIDDDQFVRPCLKCDGSYCYECMEKCFSIALQDHERMPARCCDRIFYPGVAAGFLNPTDLERYKERYDEMTTDRPFYCPVPTCSAFIPPRLQKPVDGKMPCPVCATQACCECRKVATEDHVCDRSEEMAIIDNYNYKLCPRCGNGVMKMFGCPHVRCQCGAHFCWDCRRPILACYSKPCSQSREDGDVTEESEALEESGDESEEQAPVAEEQSIPQEVDGSDSPATTDQSVEEVAPSHEVDQSTESAPSTLVPANEAPAPTQVTEDAADPAPPPETASTEPAATEANDNGPAATEPVSDVTDAEPTLVNLDDPDNASFNWEGGELDFGDEPVDENWDVWGCQHKFSRFGVDEMPDNWFKDLDKTQDVALECMCCRSAINVPGRTKVKQDLKRLKKLSKRRGRSPSSTVTLRREDASIEAAQTEDVEKVVAANDEARTAAAEKAREAEAAHEKLQKKLAAYNCGSCGVIYCWGCRKAALRRMRKERYAEV